MVIDSNYATVGYAMENGSFFLGGGVFCREDYLPYIPNLHYAVCALASNIVTRQSSLSKIKVSLRFPNDNNNVSQHRAHVNQ